VAADCGGLLRNSNGQLIGGISRHLGLFNAYLADLWGVLDGLRLSRERGITKLKVQVDSSSLLFMDVRPSVIFVYCFSLDSFFWT
jgi:hypothetical protein